MSSDEHNPDHAPHPWDRREDETDKAWGAFCLYRDMPPHERSLFAVSEALYGDDEDEETGQEPAKNRLRMPPSWVRDWSSRFSWVERARAHDDHIAEQTRQLKASARVRAERVIWDALEGLASKAVERALAGDTTLLRDLLDRGEVGSPTRVAHSIHTGDDARALFGLSPLKEGGDDE